MEGLPYLFSGGGGLYVLPEVKLSVSFLRVIGDLSDNVSLYDLSISAIYGLSPLDVQKVNTFARRRNYTLHHIFTHIDQSRIQGSEFFILSDIKDESIAIINKIMLDISFYLEFAKSHSTGEVLYQFLKRSKYLESLTSIESLENDYKLKNLVD